MQDTNTTAKVDIIEEVYETFKGIKQIIDVKYPERVWMAEMPLMYLERAYQGLKQNKPMLWYFFVLPQEMFCAWDIALFSPEVCTGIWASLGQSAISRVCHYFDVAGAHVTDALCAVN